MPGDSPTWPEIQRAIDYAVDRAVGGIKELLDARFEGMEQQLHGLDKRLDGTAGLGSRIEDHETRLTAAEAFIRAREAHRSWWLDKGWSHILGLLGFLLGLALAAHSLHLF